MARFLVNGADQWLTRSTVRAITVTIRASQCIRSSPAVSAIPTPQATQFGALTGRYGRHQHAGLNVGNVAPTRGWFTRKNVGATWSNDQSGKFADRDGEMKDGITIVELAAVKAGKTAPPSSSTVDPTTTRECTFCLYHSL